MLIKDIMTRNPACCEPTHTLDTVARLMLEQNCGEIPVCDGTRLVGVITDRDIVLRAVAAGKSPGIVMASEVMSKPVYTIDEDAAIPTALEVMEDKLVRRLPVLNKSGALVGIVSHADLIAKVPTLRVARVLRTVAKRTRKGAVAAA
jgi:CBS domain-containing protein